MKTTIATLGAGLGGGYGDTLKVYLDTDDNDIHLVVTGSVPRGGMDGDSTPFYSEQDHAVLKGDAKPAELLKAMKAIIAKDKHLFKDYGRPTKMTSWVVGHDGKYPVCEYGLSLKLCTAALKYIRGL